MTWRLALRNLGRHRRRTILTVLVIGLGTDELPGFYVPTTGLRLDHRVDDVVALAAICRARWDQLGLGGVLVCNPIPAAAALDPIVIDRTIAAAIAAAAAAGATGKRLTPFLLQHIAAATAGTAVRANRALALHNAAVGAQLAVALAGPG